MKKEYPYKIKIATYEEMKAAIDNKTENVAVFFLSGAHTTVFNAKDGALLFATFGDAQGYWFTRHSLKKLLSAYQKLSK